MPATQTDIATSLGISQYVVSNALRGVGRVAPATRERVRRAAREMGYLPNAAARATRGGRFGTVALLTSTDPMRSGLPHAMLRGIQDTLADADIDLVLNRAPDRELAEGTYIPRFLREHSCDGVLINYTDHLPPGFEESLSDQELPCLWLNTKRDADCVRPNDLHGGRSATEVLVRKGYRDIVYADYSHPAEPVEVHYSARDREAGYRQAMEAAGLSPRVIRPTGGPVGVTERTAFSRSWLERDGCPEAVVCYSPGTATPIAFAAAMLGFSVPDRLRVGSINEQAQILMDHDTTLAVVPNRATGRLVAERLLEKVDDPSRSFAPIAVPFESPLDYPHWPLSTLFTPDAEGQSSRRSP
ncbi:MAG: LacI family DNA-binding transcriptional regulator [Planctomycetota bacterium]